MNAKVNTYNDLPPAKLSVGKLIFVKNAVVNQVKDSFINYARGWYYSNGLSWQLQGDDTSKISWGNITGNINNQTDLKTEFATKYDVPTGTTAQYIRGDGSLATLPSGSGTVTSVDLTMPSAFAVSGNPITTAGTLAVTGAGTTSQYVRGDGTLANFPTSTGGGASVSYYLNGSINQGTFSGNTYYQMSKIPVIGAGTNFTIATNGYISQFITDANDPSQLNIPAGNWNFEMYFQASSNGGSPSFYVELYKWDGAAFTLIASSSTNPEGITNGTTVDLYVTALAVPATTLSLTDRLAVRVYVNNSGRTITLHTEDNNLCQVITTFTTGLTALNGLTAQVQTFATGTTGTDFNISSVTATHTFNLPVASAANTGKLSSADWTTFNNKGNGTVTSIATAGLISGGTITNTGTITTSVNTNKLVGRGTAGVGVMEEITLGTGLSLTGTTLNATGGGLVVGTTPITSGTVGRVLFEGTGNVLQENAILNLNTTNGLIIGGAIARGTRLTIVNSSDNAAVQNLVIRNAADSTDRLIIYGDGNIKSLPSRIGFNVSNELQFHIENTDGLANNVGISFKGPNSHTYITNNQANQDVRIGQVVSGTPQTVLSFRYNNDFRAATIRGTTSVSASVGLTIVNVSPNREWGILVGNTSNAILGTGGLGFLDVTSGNFGLTINGSTLNVGIGSMLAAARLDVLSSGTATTDLTLRLRNSANSANHFLAMGSTQFIFGGATTTPSGMMLLRHNFGAAADNFTVQNGEYGNVLFRVRDEKTASVTTVGSIYFGGRVYDQNATTTRQFDIGNYGLGTSYGDSTQNTVILNNSGNIGDGNGTIVISTSSNFYINQQTTKKYKFEANKGNFGIGQMTFGTNGTNVLAMATGVAPTTSPADCFQQYSADIVAGNAAPHFRTENGDIVKIYSIGGWGTPTGTLTRTTFATYAGATAGVLYDQTIMQNLIDAVKTSDERLAALISDLKTGQQLLKA
jgi:hypothetical protein